MARFSTVWSGLMDCSIEAAGEEPRREKMKVCRLCSKSCKSHAILHKIKRGGFIFLGD